jgi:hypothetical protein
MVAVNRDQPRRVLKKLEENGRRSKTDVGHTPLTLSSSAGGKKYPALRLLAASLFDIGARILHGYPRGFL